MSKKKNKPTPAPSYKAAEKTTHAQVEESSAKAGATGPTIAPSAKGALDRIPLGPRNYMLLAVGVVILAIGYGIMATEDFIDATEFSLALDVAPVVLVIGYAEIIYAILAKDPKVASAS